MAKRKYRGKTQAQILTPVTAAKAEVMQVNARYDGASNGRRMGSWQTQSSGPNTAISQLQVLRNRSRDAGRNEWQSVSATRIRTSNLVGTGIVPRMVTEDEKQKKRITDAWNAWVKDSDADGLLPYYGMQALAVRTLEEAGEVFLRVRPRRSGSGFGVPMQIQLLEPEMVPMLDADNYPGMPQGNRIRSGVEFNRMGQRVAYWLYKSHPGDKNTAINNDLVRITSEFIKHVFKPVRIGQIRGVPNGAPGLAKLRTITDVDDAIVARQHNANLFTGFLRKNSPTPDGIDPVTGKAVEYDDDGVPMAALEPGTMQELLPGEDVVFSNPPDAGTNYSDFMRWQNAGVSAVTGVPYELLTGDLKDVSDRVLRVILNDFHRVCEQDQWHILVPGLCQWVYEQWLKYSYLAGILNRKDLEVPVEWAPQAWAYVHPVQDLQAKQLEQELGLKSRSQQISERGDDPQKVDAERAADQEREIELGLSFEPVDPNAPKDPDPAAVAEAEKATAEADRAKAEARLLDVKAKRELLEGDATAARLRAAAARDEAEIKVFASRADLTVAETIAIEARAALEKAEHDARLAELAAADARASAETEARIASLEETARLAREEAAARASAQTSADEFVAEQRRLVLQAERTRAEVAQLEKEAAELGLAELRQ